MLDKKVKILDSLIVIFTMIFLATLTNSIFLNQVGYFGALLFLIIRYALTKENQFLKTGMEIPFILFIAAEIISAFLSDNPANAFENVMKRALLIPIVYTIVASAKDSKRVQRYFNTYLFFAVLSAVVYFSTSLPSFLQGNFEISNNQLAIFQYPITVSTLLSFTIIYLFAFLINEKRNWQYKLMLMVLLFICIVSIFATYKRTGWIGLGAGMAFVVLLRRKWIYIIPGVLLVIAIFVMEKNESILYRYAVSSNYMEYTTQDTEGRAFHLTESDGNVYLSDYEGGVQKVNEIGTENVLTAPKPVVQFHKWGEYYLTALTDTRFEVYKKEAGKFVKLNQFASRGFTDDYLVRNGKLYVLDFDFGLTVFNDPNNPEDSLQYKIGRDFYDLSVADSLLSIRSRADSVELYSLANGLPSSKLFAKKFESKILFTGTLFNKILIQTENELSFYDNEFGYTDLDAQVPMPPVKIITGYNKVICSGGKIYVASQDGADINFKFRKDIGFTPKSALFTNNFLYVTKFSQGRVASIFDPHLRSNFVRLSLWSAGIEMWRDNPIFGLGDIDLNETYRKYKPEFAKEVHGHLHNNYIHILAVLGLFGFIAAMWVLIKIFITNIKIVNYFRGERFSESLALGTAGAFVSFLTAGLTEWNFGDHEIITMVWFTTGLNYALYFWTKKIRKDKS